MLLQLSNPGIEIPYRNDGADKGENGKGAFWDHFTHADARFFTPGRAGHWQFDLPAYAAQRLREAGVTRIDDVRQDTYTQPERFHSYRRAGHRGEETAGRQLSIIALSR